MNYGTHHRYHARNLGHNYALLSMGQPLGAFSPATFPSRLPGVGPLYPVATTGRLQTPPPVTPKPVTPIISADAAPAICLDQSQNSVMCSDPNCTYGDCLAPAGVQQVTVGALCLDQSQNQIDCSNPNCTFGDCISSTSFWTKSTIVSGVPDVAIYGLGFLLVASLFGGGGFRVGRRR